jgi:hypothetical protein
MLSLGVAVNGAWSFNIRRKMSLAECVEKGRRRGSWRPWPIRGRTASSPGDGDRDEGLGRSVIVVQIIEASLMTCRSEMAAWERGVAEKREKCAR